MAGLRKAKKYDWKDSNMALFGSDTEKNVKKASAQHELAWRHAGQKVGVQVWRIVKFKVTTWPKEDYGRFYNGDSYIILNTYKEKDSDKLLYDVHFWIGQYSTQDEYGTAAYKTVELDTFLDGVPVQHREVQNMESDLFKTYFTAITLLKGGADTGFRSAIQEKPVKRLLHFHGKGKGLKNVTVKEVAPKKSKLNDGDVFILDLGLELFQWNGKDCNKDEKFRATRYIQELRSNRNGKPTVEVLDQGDTYDSHKFYKELEDENVFDDDDDDVDQDMIKVKGRKTLYRLSNASGELDFSIVSDGTISRSDFKSEDVFILDTHKDCFVWVGRGASEEEKKNGMTYAHNYLMRTDHATIPVTVLSEGQPSQAFDQALDNK